MRILYVEDRDRLSHCQSRGELSECELEVASGASDAIARIEECRSDPFDLAVAAASVPDDECVEVIRYVREHHLSLPVMVNAKDADHTGILATRASADGYIIAQPTDVGGQVNSHSVPVNGELSQQVAQRLAESSREELLEAIIASLPI